MLFFVSLVIFLFTTYLLSREDFVLLRKNVTVEHVFDIVFLSGMVGLLSARLLFVLLHFKPGYLNPLIFFLVPYFPGLSLVGGVLGVCLFIILYTKQKRLPTARLLDILSLSFLASLSVYVAFESVVLFFTRHFLTGGIEAALVVFLIFFTGLSLSVFGKDRWKDGSIACVNLLAFCCLFASEKLITLSLGRKIIFDNELPLFLVLFVFIVLAYIFSRRRVTRKVS